MRGGLGRGSDGGFEDESVPSDPASAESAVRGGAPRRAGWVLAALLLAAVVCNINTVVAGIAVPAIGERFDASQTALNLVALATGLGLSVSVLYLGALADRYGRKQMLLLGVGFTVVAGALSSLSWSVETLIAGSILAGAVLALASWPWVFLLSVPFAVVAFVLVLLFVPALGGLIAVGTLGGSMFVGEQFMQSVMGYSPLQAGVAVVPAVLSLLLAAPLSARAVGRLGTRSTMLIGYAFLLIAMLGMLLWREHSPYALIGASFFVIGIGVTFVLAASRRALTSSTPVRRAGMASAISDLQSDLGGAVMQALLGAVLASGFAVAFGRRIAASPEAAGIGAEATRALQASYESAAQFTSRYPQYSDEILAGARESLVDGSLVAFFVGTAVILAGAIAVRVGLPSHERERRSMMLR